MDSNTVKVITVTPAELSELVTEAVKKALASEREELKSRRLLRTNAEGEPYISAVEAGKVLGLAADTIREKAAKCEIPCVMIGRTRRYLKSQLIKWAEAQRVKTRDEEDAEVNAWLIAHPSRFTAAGRAQGMKAAKANKTAADAKSSTRKTARS